MVNKNELELALRNSWDIDTTANQEQWSLDNPSRGQCVVTALVTQDYLEGEIVWANAQLSDRVKESHYWNIVNGKNLDFTREQFPQGTIIPPGRAKLSSNPDDPPQYNSTREYVLSYPFTVERYQRLKEKVEDFLSSLK